VGQQNRFEAHPWRARLLVLCLCLLFLECVARGLVFAGLLSYRLYPTTAGAPGFWGYIDPVVGIWRHPNAAHRHDEACIHVEYRTNSAGARDRERRLTSGAKRRVAVLGDSFVEGYGIEDRARFTDLLEARTRIEFLNFGSSGGFGTIQEWLVYATRARQYEHSDVVLFINPANDFKDNDPEEFEANVYRPFLRRRDSGYEVYYPVAWDKRETAARSRGTVLRNVALNNIYLWNVLRNGAQALRERTREQRLAFKEAHYDHFRPADLKVLLHALDEFVRAAGARSVWLLTIPSASDFHVARRDGAEFDLPAALRRFDARYPNVRYLDLLPEFLRDAGARGLVFEDYLLPCDNHWSARGHALVAATLERWMLGRPVASVPVLPRRPVRAPRPPPS